MIKEGDLVLLWFDEKRKWVVRVERGRRFESDRGVLMLDDVIGKEYGESVLTSKGWKVFLLRPTLTDLLEEFRRRTQVIYPKDIGYIIMRLGIRPGMKVLEAGTGSGFVTASLSWFGARVYSFEIRKEHLRTSMKNLERFGLRKNVIYIYDDVTNAPEVLGERSVDAAIIDLADPWEKVESVARTLRGGSPAAFFLPTYNQLEKLKESLKPYFTPMEVYELMMRKIKVERGATRPEQIMIGFTGFIVITRKKRS